MENIDTENLNTQARRWMFTINNPFADSVEDIDISKTDIPIKEDYYKGVDISMLEDSDCFDFKYVKVNLSQDEFSTKEYIVKRPFFKSYEHIGKYLESLESFKYCIYQLEKGEEGTNHIQGFIVFKSGKRFRTVRSFLPMSHLEKAKGSNTQCRDYCSKSDTRQIEPVEIGQFAEERERTDYKEFLELSRSGISNMELSKLFPMLYVRERNKVADIKSDLYEHYAYTLRSVKVTYIYGSSGVGKTTWLRRNVGLKDSYLVDQYDNSAFTYYNYQDNLVLDEFAGGFSLQNMNKLLDIMPYKMRGLNSIKYASYHNVYIISNYSLKELYKNEQMTSMKIYKALDRRIHKIIRVDNNGNFILERDSEWEPCTDSLDREQGLTCQVKKTWQFDDYGNKLILYDRYSAVPELQEIKNVNMPFPELVEQEEIDF